MELVLEIPVSRNTPNTSRYFRVRFSDVGYMLLETLARNSIPVECIDRNGNVIAITYIDRVDKEANRIVLKAAADCVRLRIRLRT